MDAPLITLTTDFGTRDAYVAAMKGVMLDICPEARFVDITHEISPQDVMEAAFVLRQAVSYFPADAVHLVVIDPGVGTDRHPIALRHGAHWYVGPDNGLFPLVLENEAPDQAVVLDREAMWHTTAPSQTFHGRDIFAPAAAHLAAGQPLDALGSPLDSLTPLRWAEPIADKEGIQGWVVHIDRFGNCITNISRSMFERYAEADRMKCFAGSATFTRVYRTYGDVPEGDPLLLFGSSDFLEVSVNAGNAAELLDIRKGDAVNLIVQEEAE